jgi:tRNA (cmo5U34)-methyltransferase
VPYYQLVHQTMIDILTYHFNSGRPGGAEKASGIVLDVGAGTGTESLSVMQHFPGLKTLAVDICKPMKAIFEKNYEARFGTSEKRRYTYLVEDIMKVSSDEERVKAYLTAENERGCSAAISAYCIHHFPLADKGVIYKKMFDFLKPGGLLINMDLFNYKSKAMSEQAHAFDLAYIRREFDDPSPQFVNSRSIPLAQRQKLKNKWLDHMNNDNMLDTVEDQIRQLQAIGFVDVECVFKYWQQGVIRARKPDQA